ncbi:uromodulin-like [Colossoma macropomum]|uniref:uromodulin-like n=1 Tax=Colossoma macropomum TaxID=42526 RepID=UPI0018654F86|nr:uromodulin-like [Colossoma macropomum]
MKNTIVFLTWVTVVLLTTITDNSAANLTATSNDPCNNYTSLDQPWRATNATGLWICDRFFNWNGWYRLLYNEMSVRMPESCVNQSRCGTDIALWLNGSHPQIEDGIVTRGVCGSSGSDCCYYRSTPIRVKACPGNYYVYEFVRPDSCVAAYCADVNTITPNTAPTNVTSVAASNINTTDTANNMTFDPCSLYSVLDNNWRRTDSGFYHGSFDDTLLEWSGWYRLYLQGQSAQIPESNWCWSFVTCGGYTALLLGGSHPQPQDGIVTREIFGTYVSSVDSRQCNSYRSNPIQVKACPGNYYVYRLVKPAVLLPIPTYCAETSRSFGHAASEETSKPTTVNLPDASTRDMQVILTDKKTTVTAYSDDSVTTMEPVTPTQLLNEQTSTTAGQLPTSTTTSTLTQTSFTSTEPTSVRQDTLDFPTTVVSTTGQLSQSATATADYTTDTSSAPASPTRSQALSSATEPEIFMPTTTSTLTQTSFMSTEPTSFLVPFQQITLKTSEYPVLYTLQGTTGVIEKHL